MSLSAATPAFRGLRTLMSDPEGAIGITLGIVVLIVTVLGPYLAPYDPSAVHMSARLAAPSLAHPFGTDELGRDLLSRVIVGAQQSIPAGLVVVVWSAFFGTAVGILAGYYGKWIDMLLMRLTDVFVGYPALLLAIAVAAALGAGLEQAVVALGTVWWAGYARLARGQAAAIRSSLSIDAARSIGASDIRILIWHVLPSVMGSVIVKATLDVALVIQSIAGLGFIGLGAQPPSSEWGLMIATSQTFAFTSWWYAVFPGIALFIVIEAFNLIGDALTKMRARA